MYRMEAEETRVNDDADVFETPQTKTTSHSQGPISDTRWAQLLENLWKGREMSARKRK